MATPENTGTTTETADTRTLMSFAKPSTDFIYLDTPCEATTGAAAAAAETQTESTAHTGNCAGEHFSGQ